MVTWLQAHPLDESLCLSLLASLQYRWWVQFPQSVMLSIPRDGQGSGRPCTWPG